MKVKELRKIFNELPEDWEVVVSDTRDASIEIVDVDHAAPIVYIETRHVFPDEWFDEKTSLELHTIDGKTVRIVTEEIEDDILLGDDVDFTKCICKDGAAYRKSDGLRVLTYPKMSELTNGQILGIDNALGGRVSDSGFIGPDDVAVVMGKPVEPPKSVLTDDLHCVVESIQNMTLYCWASMYGVENPYDIGAAEVLETLRRWGEEFEHWWQSHDEEFICSHHYEEELWHFADEKLEKWVKDHK